MLHRVVWQTLTDVSEELTASIIGAIKTDRSEISGSHGDEYEDGCILGRCTVYSGRY
jgi:hypothetical protein